MQMHVESLVSGSREKHGLSDYIATTRISLYCRTAYTNIVKFIGAIAP